MVKGENGEPASKIFSYRIIVGILLYMYGYNIPDVYLAVNSCYRCMFIPKRSQKLELKRLAHYLNQTKDRGLVLNTNSDLCKVDKCSDANFSGMNGHEDPTYTACVKSHTGFTINFLDCTIFWFSKLQTDTALSTMKA